MDACSPLLAERECLQRVFLGSRTGDTWPPHQRPGQAALSTASSRNGASAGSFDELASTHRQQPGIAMPKIRFLPADVVLEVAEGTTIFGAARKSEVAVPSQCGGRCACALCRVEIVEGGHLVSPIRWDEEEHLGNSFHLTGQRLSCLSLIHI